MLVCQLAPSLEYSQPETATNVMLVAVMLCKVGAAGVICDPLGTACFAGLAGDANNVAVSAFRW